MTEKLLTVIPPEFCQYANGSCDQDMKDLSETDAFFIYPSQPSVLAHTVKECVRELRTYGATQRYRTWEDLSVSGQIIFCEICKAIRGTRLVVANITNTNFNVLFELGFAIGLGKAVLPVRDTTFKNDRKVFDEIGIFDTLGYEKFTSSKDLVSAVQSIRNSAPPLVVPQEINRAQPIYYIKSPIETDGSIKLTSCMKKGYFRFRSFDAKEVARLSLHEAVKQTLTSTAVVAHLLDPDREGAIVHNSRAAFVCGMALSAGRNVLMLQEGHHPQPLDYRDIVVPYTNPDTIPIHVERVVRATAESLQTDTRKVHAKHQGLLERVDLGDVAAENEISALRSYFVRTPQFLQAKQGHARLVVGRKGAGKTALFYGVRNAVAKKRGLIVLDLKPEGHQFAKLRELVLFKMTAGLQQHTMTAFWYYLLIIELANKILRREVQHAFNDNELLLRFKRLEAAFSNEMTAEGDFSERLMLLVNRIATGFEAFSGETPTDSDITRSIYAGDSRALVESVNSYLAESAGVWILFDNVDKGFPTHGLTKEDVLIVRGLLEASRKVQRSIEKLGVECVSILFLRRDVHDHLIDETPDRGKEPVANLDWSDLELIKELLLKRFSYELSDLGDFDEAWTKLFTEHVSGESSFRYIVDRTFLRPRDILNFARKCINVAVGRGHSRVSEADIQDAEAEYSEDMLNELRLEIRDVFPDNPDVLFAFLGKQFLFDKDDIRLLLLEVGVCENELDNVIRVLTWFSFLGVRSNSDTDLYTYMCNYNVEKVFATAKRAGESAKVFTVHPAFRKSLSV